MQKSIFTNALIVALLLVSLFFILTIFAKTREQRAAENWARTFGEIEDIPKQYPYQHDNDAAVKLEVLSNRLGIDFAFYGERRRHRPFYSDIKRLQEANEKGHLWKYFRKQLERTDETIDPPSEILMKYLSDYDKQIKAAKDHLLTSSPIVWRQNLNGRSNYGPDPDLPNTDAMLGLQKIIMVRALQLAAARTYADAEEYLEAGWRLNDSLRSRPELDLQLKAIQFDQIVMGLMRKLPVHHEWISRVMSHNYEKAITKGFQVEAWFLWRMRNEEQVTRSSMINNALDPYVQISFASLLESERKDIQRIQSLDPCSLGRKEFRDFQPERPPKWNRIRNSRWLLWDKNSTYGTITKLRIDRELTAKIIQVRHGYFPKDGIEKSGTCKNGLWNFSRLPDGWTSIQYAGRLEQPTIPFPNLPTSFVVSGN